MQQEWRHDDGDCDDDNDDQDDAADFLTLNSSDAKGQPLCPVVVRVCSSQGVLAFDGPTSRDSANIVITP